MSQATLTITVDETLKTAFAEAAKAQDRDAEDLLRELMRAEIDRLERHDAWFRAEVEQALREADAPDAEWVSHEEVRRESEERRARWLRMAEGMV